MDVPQAELEHTQDLYESIFRVLYYISGSIALVANFTLLFMVAFRSPRYLSPYKYLIANNAISDIALAIGSVFHQCRLIPNKWAFAFIAMGPSAYFGEQASFHSFVLQMHSLFYIFMCFPIHFAYRYYILVRPAPKNSSVLLMIFLMWLVPVAQVFIFLAAEAEPSRIREYLRENKPYYFPYLDKYVLSGAHMLWNYGTNFVCLSVVVPMFPIYVIVFFFYRKVHKFLDSKGGSRTFGDSTKRGHQRLLKALIIQAILPFFFVFPPIIMYLAYHIELVQFTIIEYLVFLLFSYLPAANPFISLYFIQSYRVALLRGLRINVLNASTAENTSYTITNKIRNSIPQRTISVTRLNRFSL